MSLKKKKKKCDCGSADNGEQPLFFSFQRLFLGLTNTQINLMAFQERKFNAAEYLLGWQMFTFLYNAIAV